MEEFVTRLVAAIRAGDVLQIMMIALELLPIILRSIDPNQPRPAFDSNLASMDLENLAVKMETALQVRSEKAGAGGLAALLLPLVMAALQKAMELWLKR